MHNTKELCCMSSQHSRFMAGCKEELGGRARLMLKGTMLSSRLLRSADLNSFSVAASTSRISRRREELRLLRAPQEPVTITTVS